MKTGLRGYKGHIAIDMDDVIVDLVGGVRQVIRKEYDIDLPEFTSWDLNQWLKPILGEPWMKWMRRRDWLWPTFPAIDGAIGGLSTLRQRGYYLEIVTSKPEWAEAGVFEWLGKWRPPVHRVTILDTRNYRKVDVTDADFIVDDKPENVLGFVEENRWGILFDKPHNRGYTDLPRGIRRAVGWSEVLEIVAEEDAA